ncbi:Alpha-ketoglutarate-dependent dioxygenase alkB-like protein 2 [Hibiscus syriacus]|uniref:Alpha-ketoglutarate-dependent dioxygenase alkB-like protein 2 n=1 Tax=Hibiscus syriacus TaxID=106335 RepID=A0A6A2YC93_HIBSY|nr:DNA oxidative demethylase ALKBH2-like [Hibiscus syriacus]KAE8670527.1 Alpha-ketoglutarate-dependent dioxygenase alkB-like protein 2 [Hibiscus syriacus]
MSLMNFKLKTNPNPDDKDKKTQIVDLGNGSSVVYVPRFLAYDASWEFFNYLDNHIPWTRPTIRVFGRSCIQPRDTCYVASAGLPDLIYSGYQPHAYSWDDFPPLKDILDAVHKMLPGSKFNSLLLNRYKGGNDYVGWHSDDEKLYGSTPEIASVSFGCERDFFLKKKSPKSSQVVERSDEKPPLKRFKKSSQDDQYRFALKHGSLLVMKGNTQRDWLHSVPKRAKAGTTRINLTFRRVIEGPCARN